jgi:TP901 family phage tail tape measure protein
MALGLEVASLSAVLSLDDRQFNQNLQNADSKMARFDRSLSGVANKWKDFGRAAQIASVPIGLALGKGFSDAMSFDSALSEISARTGVVGEGLKDVERKALSMGAATQFSAQDAANGMLELLASGDDLATAMGRIDDVLTLATVGNLDLKTAADGVTDVMASMRLEAGQTAGVVDIMTKATASSSATMTDMMDSLASGGNLAADYGLNILDASAAMAVLAENGIKGSEAGTNMRSMLLNMTRPTEAVQGAWNELGVTFYDTEGNVRDFNQVIVELDAALDMRTPAEQNELMKTLAGSYGYTALSALRAAGGIDTMRNNMSQQRSATEIAEAKMNTFEGKLISLRGSLEALNIKAFTPFMNDVLKPIVGRITDVVNEVGIFAEQNPEATKTVIGLGMALVGGTTALSGLGIMINLVKTGLSAFLVTAINPLTAALVVGAGLVLAYTNNWGGFRDFIDTQVRPTILQIIDDVSRWNGVLQDTRTIIDGILSGKWSVGEAIDAAFKAVQNEMKFSGVQHDPQDQYTFQRPGSFKSEAHREQYFADIQSGAVQGWNPHEPNYGQTGTATLLSTNQYQAYADGGDYGMNELMMVGERGPELMRPDSSGTVIPNHMMGGGMTINVYTNNSNGHDIGRDIYDELRRKGIR